MLSYFRWVLFFIALFVTVMGGALLLGNTLLTASGPLDKTKNIVIARGAGPATMAKDYRLERKSGRNATCAGHVSCDTAIRSRFESPRLARTETS